MGDSKRLRSANSDIELSPDTFVNRPKQPRYHSPTAVMDISQSSEHFLVDMKTEILDKLTNLTIEVSGNSTKLADVLNKNETLENEVLHLKTENGQLLRAVATLESRQARTEQVLRKLQDANESATIRQMSLNIMVYGVPEQELQQSGK